MLNQTNPGYNNNNNQTSSHGRSFTPSSSPIRGGSKKKIKKVKSTYDSRDRDPLRGRQAESLTMMLNAYTDSLHRLDVQRSHAFNPVSLLLIMTTRQLS